ncbi:MAG: hypothetical protein HOO86_05340 [Bacteroidales bacterium]|nr:hypothetical protein [Bacteroidales bacterium]
MKTDHLEQFIIENKAEFDTLEPSEKMWERIESEQNKKMKFKIRPLLYKITAAAAIFIAGYFLSDLMHFRNAQSSDVVTESTVSPEIQAFLEARAYYTSLINQKESQVFQLAGDNPQLKTDINNEFKHLDKIYKELEQDLSDQVANEEVIEAMIQHYRIKLNILEDMLQQLKPDKSAKESEVQYVI